MARSSSSEASTSNSMSETSMSESSDKTSQENYFTSSKSSYYSSAASSCETSNSSSHTSPSWFPDVSTPSSSTHTSVPSWFPVSYSSTTTSTYTSVTPGPGASDISGYAETYSTSSRKEKSLHILINNAGVTMCPKEKTEDGFGVQFQTNYLGPFLLTELLLDMLKESAPSRIINTTASAQNLGDIKFDDINHEKDEHTLGDMYAQSKLAVILYTFQLAERLKDTI